MPNVILTIDTELWPRGPLSSDSITEAVERDFYGMTPRGEVGLRYQIDVLNACGLKAVFFVEALHASLIGREPLQDIVDLIRSNGHDIQLHVHTEWLEKKQNTLLPGRTGQHMHQFTYAEQVTLLRESLDNLIACGIEEPIAFRAGSFGANRDTLEACQRVGLHIDSSYNVTYLDQCCELETSEPLIQPTDLFGIREYPVSFFNDITGHRRHAQLSACSSGEMIDALNNSADCGWDSFVILSHSFELLRWRQGQGHIAFPDRVMLKRFDKLCAFLADHRETFNTTTFSALGADGPLPSSVQPVHAGSANTAWRMAEQFARRYWV